MNLVSTCGLMLRISGDGREIDMLLGVGSDIEAKGYSCPSCGESMSPASVVEGQNLLNVVDLTPQEAFTAFNGMGLPSERDCGETAVRELLKLPIASVDVSQIAGANRSAIHSITFGDGRTLYLASGAHGATAYRIIGKRNLVKELFPEGADDVEG